MNWKQIKHLRNQIGDKHKCSVATICGTKYLFVLYEDKNIQDYIYNKFRYYLPPNTILGLHPDFLHLPFFQQRWELKKKKKAEKSKAELPKTPKGLVNDFKVWSYKKVLPKQIA